MTREYVDYLNDMLDGVQKAEAFVAGVSFEEFEANEEKQFAVIRALEIIGEAARSIPESVRAQNLHVPWREIVGMRDKLIHAYFGVDIHRVWTTVKDDLPGLRQSVAKMLSELSRDEDG